MFQGILDIYSTTTRDVITDHVRGGCVERVAGPAFFLSRVFEIVGVPVRVYTGAIVDVRIDLSEKGEIGMVSAVELNEVMKREKHSTHAVCSTVLNEWNPLVLASVYDSIYLDVQGFVRVAGVFGKKRMWNDFRGSWMTTVCCLKATWEELTFLPEESVEDQKTRILLVTRGTEGVDVYAQGRCTTFSPPRIVTGVDTIGAGDTFFAHVVARLVFGDPLQVAVTEALEQTCRFLEAKTKTS